MDHFEELCKTCEDSTDTPKTKANNCSAKRHDLTLVYRYTLDELKAIHRRMVEKTRAYAQWCRKVETILSRESVMFEIMDVEEEIVDRYSDDDQNDEADDIQIVGESKPTVRTLGRLVEQARVNKYPRRLGWSVPGSGEVDVVSLLEKELARALDCSNKCQRFLAMYKKYVEKKAEKNEAGGQDAAHSRRRWILNTPRPKLGELKSLADDIQRLVCDIDDQHIFRPLVNEAQEKEKRIERIISEWNTDENVLDETRALLEYLDRIAIEFPYELVDNLRHLYRQAEWCKRLNESDKLTIPAIKQLIDDFDQDAMRGVRCSLQVKKQFEELVGLLSTATQYNDQVSTVLNRLVRF